MDSSFSSDCDSDCSCGEDRMYSDEGREKLQNDIKGDSDNEGNRNIDSEEDVVLLGEKRPTYEEITLEEDEEGSVVESVIEKAKRRRIPGHLSDLLYHCPNCEKSFRVESLLKFHIRMHGVIESPLTSSTLHDNTQSCSNKQTEKENVFRQNINQDQQDKYGRRKKKIPTKRLKEKV